MFNRMLMAALASSALASAPLLAAPGGGHGPANGHGNSGNAGGNAGASAGASGGPAGAALDARINSMGSANASPNALEHASPTSALSTNSTTNTTVNTKGSASTNAVNSATARLFPNTKTTTTVQSGSLSGLSTGMNLTSNGTTVGTVQQIRTTGNGNVSVVIVQGTNGQLFAIPANKLTLADGALTTTARLNGINGGTNPAVGVSQGPNHASANGIAHASPRSVLAAGAVAASALPGLTTGLAVQSGTGTSIGTVSQVVTDNGGNIRLVIVTSPTGETIRLSPTTLTMSGDTLVTTQPGIGG